jgi:hypothetical protein
VPKAKPLGKYCTQKKYTVRKCNMHINNDSKITGLK